MNGSPLTRRKVRVKANNFIQIESMAVITYVSESEKKLLLKMDAPITISGVTYTHAVVSPRLNKDCLNTLFKSGVLGCSITWVSKDRFDLSKPLDLSWWRGGAAAIADVMLD